MKKMIVVMMVAALSVTGTFATPSVDAGSEGMTPKSCTIRIKGDFNGDKVDIYVTVEADNCAEAAGAMLRAYATK
jgi:hypothetical protein